MGRRSSAIENGTLALGVVAGVGGATGGVGYYLLTPYLAPTVTTLGLSSATGTGAAVTDASLSGLSLQQLNQLIHGTQQQLLKQLFRKGVEGAQQALESGEVPPALTREALLVYREIAKRAIENGIDKGGVQALRLKSLRRR